LTKDEVSNEGYPASLEPRKVYRHLPDTQAEAHHLLRVVDESGEDYLYPVGFFAPINLPQDTVEALGLAA
jgi:hypothetical protein